MTKAPDRLKLRQRLRAASDKGKSGDPGAKVPGPSDNPATNLMLADIAMRMGSYVLRRLTERAFLRGRYGKDTAKDIVQNRSLGRSLASVAVAKFGTRSLPGAAIVGTGLVAKLLIERSRSRHEAQAEGDTTLIAQSEGESSSEA